MIRKTSAAKDLFGALDDQGNHIIFGHLIRDADVHQFTILQNRDSVTEIENVVDVMAYQKDPDILFLQLIYQIPDPSGFFYAQHSCRFVHEIVFSFV